MFESSPHQVLIGQLTDTHVVGDASPADGLEDLLDGSPDGVEMYVDNNGRLRDAVASINAEVPALDVVIATGDLTNGGDSAAYDTLAALLDPLVVPVLPLAGNHDDRVRLRATFPGVPWVDADHLSWATIVAGVRIIGLDSTVPGEQGGGLDPERVAWLDSVLAQSHDGVTLLAMHHPPFETGIGWMDAYGFDGLNLLEAVVAGSGIDRIITGHLHRPMTSVFAGVPALVGMSTVQHVALDLGEDGRVAVIRDPFGYQIHRVVGRTVVSHSRFIGDEQPIIPSWASDH